MKKLIAMTLAFVLVLSLCACSQNEDPQNTSNNNQMQNNQTENNQTSNTESTGNSSATNLPNTDPDDGLLHIRGLKPTGNFAELKYIKLTEHWATTNSITSIQHIKNSKYMYMSSNSPVYIENEWSVGNGNNICHVKIADIDKDADKDCYYITIVKMDDVAGLPIFNIVFDADAKDLTVNEAYEQQKYSYVIASASDNEFDKNVENIVGDNENPLDTFIEKMGQPSEVFYTEFTDHLTFTIIYRFPTYSIVLEGYEKFGVDSNEHRLWLSSIQKCGNNSVAFANATRVDGDRVQLGK